MDEKIELAWPLQPSPTGLTYDLDVRKGLLENQRDLFVSNGPVEVHVAWVDREGKTSVDLLKTESDVRECARSPGRHRRYRTDSSSVDEECESARGVGVRASYFLVNPAFTRSELPVTLRGTVDLLAGLGAFSELYRNLTAFGRKSFSKDEGFGGYDWAESVAEDGRLSGFESCYLLKYVQKRGRARPGANPWSISQSLVYQKVSFDAERTDHILVKPSEALTSRLNHSFTQEPAVAASIASDWTRIHTMAFGSVDEPFRDCFNFIDEKVSEIFGRVMMSGVEPGKLREFDTLESSSRDMKSLQAFVDMALRAKHSIDVNLETLDAMTQVMNELRGRHPSTNPTQMDSLLRSLKKMRQQHRLSIKNFASLIERAKSLSEQLRNTISIRDSAATIELTVRSGYEAHVVKVLTDFLQMGYVSKAQSAGFKLSATDDLQIYAVLAIPLIVTTMLVYVGVELYQHRSWKRSIGTRVSVV
ncbi:hypothetical protein INS49_009854 [Diaporthe citri]|uniref:uncharacterized protein n=1 Tax=Diaporthe citri TaxID=83186 RepID=UPI001C7F889E|nr:uncharacterized protein INS49_009854 [Diaporthe citri]KAG6361627.1 hypothetical protein INS49_009854 [Diaporthe citri]